MRKLTILLAIGIISLFVSSCEKDQEPQDTDNPRTVKDSATLLLGKWKYVRDSSTNTGNYYFSEGGINYYPMPGVYVGTAEDFVEFFQNGNITIHGNQNTYYSKYQLFPNNKLVIVDMLVHDTGTVIKLTASDAIFDWHNTSPNGGQYFKRMYLKK